MNINSELSLDFKQNTNLYYDLLIEEDFDFKTKNIKINIVKEKKKINISFKTTSIIDLKIGTNAILKSLEIIKKSLNI